MDETAGRENKPITSSQRAQASAGIVAKYAVAVDAELFDRWLALFEQTARELFPAEAADHFMSRARQIAESLELGVADGHGVLSAPW